MGTTNDDAGGTGDHHGLHVMGHSEFITLPLEEAVAVSAPWGKMVKMTPDGASHYRKSVKTNKKKLQGKIERP